MTDTDKKTPVQSRRVAMRGAAITLLATIAWLLALFLARKPAIDYFCICLFLPLFLASAWISVGWHLIMLIQLHQPLDRRRIVALIAIAFFLAPYCFCRAGSDMFTLSVEYHLWRAGGSERVRNAFNQWVAARPAYDPAGQQKMLFSQIVGGKRHGGPVVALLASQLPPEVRYIHEKFPSRFGQVWKDVADVDNVDGLTTTDILIGPPGWQPEGGATLWNHITGSRRKLADGIWVEFGLYDK